MDEFDQCKVVDSEFASITDDVNGKDRGSAEAVLKT